MMTRLLSLMVFALALFQCGCSKPEGNTHGCSPQVSEQVYLGHLELDEIEEISFLESSQKGLYPVPDWEARSNELVTFRAQEFFERFDNALRKNAFTSGEYVRGDVQTLHILIRLRGKEDAYFCGFAREKGFMLTPMFEQDSYGGINNAVLSLFLAEKVEGQ